MYFVRILGNMPMYQDCVRRAIDKRARGAAKKNSALMRRRNKTPKKENRKIPQAQGLARAIEFCVFSANASVCTDRK